MASADIRYAAAALNKELAKNHESLVNDPKALLSLIQRNQELGRQAKKSSDAAFLLGNDTRMAGLVAGQAKRLTSYMKATPATFMKELMKKFPSASGEGVDWVQFGIKTSSYTREPPTGGDLFHLMGPFDVGPKVRKAQAPRVVRGEDKDLAEKKTVVASSSAAAGQGGAPGARTVMAPASGSATAQLASRHDALYKDIKELLASRGERVIVREPASCREWEAVMLPLLDTLFDPYSYTATVENLFYFSRLIKEGWASIMYARRAAGKEDKPGGAAAGKPWEVYISVIATDAAGKRKLHSVVPPEAVLAADAPKGGEEGGGAGGGAKRAREATGAKEEARARAEEEERKRKALGVSLQMVVELDYESWKVVCAKRGLVAPAVGHRRVADSTAPMGFKFRDELPGAGGGGGGGGSSSSSGALAGKRSRPAQPAEEEEDEEEEEEVGEGEDE